jgi:type III pantothenate kinase|tara:strand:- start:207 stop:983 length:777 start_codon:yes stop_codon:yes gene_type:complete
MDEDMLLAVDIGNTHITLGVFEGEKLGPRWRMATLIERTSDEFGLQMLGFFRHSGLIKDDIQAVIIASVVPTLTSRLLESFNKYLGLDALVVDAGIKTGVSIRCDDPRQVGADRVVDAAAVRALYGYPACIVDFGTATTFDAISDSGEYLGGAIAPGIEIAADALFHRAAKLPRVDIVRPPNVIGRNTQHAIQSGLLFGYVGLVQYMVNNFRLELGSNMQVIGTGGLAETISRESDIIDVVAPWLTLEGLQVVWSLNK